MDKQNQMEDKKSSKKKKDGEMPRTMVNQNVGYNAKKVGLGPNANR